MIWKRNRFGSYVSEEFTIHFIGGGWILTRWTGPLRAKPLGKFKTFKAAREAAESQFIADNEKRQGAGALHS